MPGYWPRESNVRANWRRWPRWEYRWLRGTTSLGRARVPLNPPAADQLATRTRPPPSHTVRSLVDHAPYVRTLDEIRHLREPESIGVVALVDADDRPIAVLTPDTWTVGLVEPGLRVNVDTPIAEAALRAMTRGPSTRFTPLLCMDGAGRYLGVIPVERLVHAMAVVDHVHSPG